MDRIRLYPVTARLIFVFFALGCLGLGGWIIASSYRWEQPLLLLLAAPVFYLVVYLIQEASKELIIDENQLIIRTILKKRMLPKQEVLGFVDILLPTTKRLYV